MSGSESEMRLRSSASTSIGQVRENNEDNVRLWEEDDFVVAVVADGMGGAVAGEEASRIAVDSIEEGALFDDSTETPLDLSDEQVLDWLRKTIRAANVNIVHRAFNNPELRGMGTTMTMAFVRRNRALIAHVGDSRAYLVDGHTRRITQITADHSFVEALVAAGHLTHEQAEEHPMRNVLYRALGQNEDVDVDVYETRLRSGDRLVLCSDGLTRHVKPSEIAAITSDEENPEAAGQALINLANERGGEDNVSVIIIMLDGDDRDEDTSELKNLFLVEDDHLVRKDRRATDTVEIPISDEDDTLKMNDTPPLGWRSSSSEGRDTRAPEQ